MSDTAQHQQTIRKAFGSDFTVNEGERSVVALISTAAVDRDGEVLVPQGMNSKDFERNPVVMLNHDYYTLPIGKVVSLKREPSGVTAKVVFAERPRSHPAGEEWVPDTILSLFQQGVLSAFSVGFIPLENRAPTPRDVGTYGDTVRNIYSKWSLLELSVVPLPANQEAVAVAVSKGFVKAETAQKLFGDAPVEAKLNEAATIPPANEAAKEEAVAIEKGVQLETVVVAAEPSTAPNTVSFFVPPAQAKRLLYIFEPDGPVAHSVDAKTVATEAVAKARGRVYLI